MTYEYAAPGLIQSFFIGPDIQGRVLGSHWGGHLFVQLYDRDGAELDRKLIPIGDAGAWTFYQTTSKLKDALKALKRTAKAATCAPRFIYGGRWPEDAIKKGRAEYQAHAAETFFYAGAPTDGGGQVYAMGHLQSPEQYIDQYNIAAELKWREGK